MTTGYRQYPPHAHPPGRRARLALACGIGLILGAGPALAQDGFCSATATALFRACQSEVKDDFFTAHGEVHQRLGEGGAARVLGRGAHGEQGGQPALPRAARRPQQLCKALGEDRYDPDFDPADFDDDFSEPHESESVLPARDRQPLGLRGRRRDGRGRGPGRDQVDRGRDLHRGARPRRAGRRASSRTPTTGSASARTAPSTTAARCSQKLRELRGRRSRGRRSSSSLEGSWKAGRDGDRPGTLFPGSPTVGAVYRQELSPGNAEDAARVLSTTYGFGTTRSSTQFVPQALAELLCAADDCVVTGEFIAALVPARSSASTTRAGSGSSSR